jgi:predicted nucleotidyltransferase
VKKQDSVVESFLKGIRKERPRIQAIYLFGSRARADAQPDSDYDLLLVTDKKDPGLKDRVYDVATDVSLQTRRDLSLKFFSAEEFDRLKAIPSHFIRQVLAEGIKLG